jgi:pyrroloquinoline-quinone synthase
MTTTTPGRNLSRALLSTNFEGASAELIDRVLRHPFLRGCSDGTTSLDQLRSFLAQQGQYSKYFTRFLCALISNLEEGGDVLKLAENLAEELGYGDDDHDQRPHSEIYANMLADFGVDLVAHPIRPETQNLIDTMFMLCQQPQGIAGLGAMCLGAEALVPSVYARIVEGFQHHGVELKRLDFFTIHIECDDGHAETMYRILAKKTERTPSHQVTALNAGEIAVSARLRFFDALLTGVQ